MGIFSPQLSTQIRAEDPVQAPSSLGSFATLATAFAGTIKPTKAPSTAAIKDAAERNFYLDLNKAQNLRSQGKEKEAAKLVGNAYNRYSSQYGASNEDINEAFQDFSGVSANVFVTGGAGEDSAFRESPTYPASVAAMKSQYPDASDGEIDALALQFEKERATTAVKITTHENNTKANWIDMQADYTQAARSIGTDVRGILDSAEADSVITPEEAKAIRQAYHTMVDSVRKPVNVSQEEWNEFKGEYITPLTKAVDGAIGIGQQVGISQDQNRALQQIIAKAVAQGKLPGSFLIRMEQTGDDWSTFTKMLSTMETNPKYADNINRVLTSTYPELLEWVSTFENKTTTEDLKVDVSEWTKLSSSDKRTSIIDDAKMISSEQTPEQLALSVVELNTKIGSLEQRALNPGDFAKVYNNGFFKSLTKIFEANPTVGRELVNQTLDQMNGQRIAISRAFTKHANQLGFDVDVETGTLTPNPDGRIGKATLNVVDEHFGGDWGKAIEMRGKSPDGIVYSEIAMIANEIENRLIPQMKKFQGVSRAVDQLTNMNFPEEVTGKVNRNFNLEEEVKNIGLGREVQQEIPSANDEVTTTVLPPKGYTGTATSLIKSREGFRAKAYWDVDNYRAGYGSDTVTRRDGTVEKVTKDTIVTREDAERDLARREQEFARAARTRVGPDIWDTLPGNVTDPLTSIAYNYGSVPKRLLSAVRSRDIESIATAIEGLAGDNNGINRKRRMEEAAIVRGKTIPPRGLGPVYAPSPVERPDDLKIPTFAPDTSLRPEARPVPEISNEIIEMLKSHNLTPEETKFVSDAAEAELLAQQGVILPGDRIVVGTGLDAEVWEYE